MTTCINNECRLCNSRSMQVPGFGPPPESACMVLVGEAPGSNEAAAGIPFVGKAGQLLRAVLMAAGVDEDDVYFTNVAKCHPPANRISDNEIACCKSYLHAELKEYAAGGVPIGLLGGVASRAVLGSRYTNKMRDRWHKNGKVLSTWHPSYFLHQPNFAQFWEFYFAIRRLAAGKQTPLEPEYSIIEGTDDGFAAFENWLARLHSCYQHESPTFCFDLETERASPYWMYDVLSMAIATSEDRAVVLTEQFLYDPRGQKLLKQFFDGPWKLVGHNVKFDLRYLKYHLGIDNARAEYDSLLAHYVMYEEMGHSLKQIARQYCDAPAYDEQHINRFINPKKDNWRGVPPAILMHYNVLDVCYNLKVWNTLADELRKADLWQRPFMFPIMASQPALLRAELLGAPIDMDRVENVSAELGAYGDELHETLEEMCGFEFNPRSPKQVSPIIYEHFGAPVVTGRGFKPGSTCDDARQKILQRIDPGSELGTWLQLYGQYRSVAKIKSSYVDCMFEAEAPDGRVHADLRVHGARTGRMSVRGPPLHSIPKPGHNRPGTPDWGLKIRGVFTADPEWYIVMADYSQAEMRVMACLSQDPFLLDAYRQGKDLHSEAARFVFGDDFTKRHRQICKSVNFSQAYGGGAESAPVEADMDPRDIKRLSARYHEMMPGLYNWRDEQYVLLKKRGYVATMTDRRRRAPIVNSQNYKDMKKMAINAPVQGSASELTLISFMMMDEWIMQRNMQRMIELFLTVHDSCLQHVHRSVLTMATLKLQEIMTGVGEEYFPEVPWKVDIEIGPAWGELVAHEFNGTCFVPAKE